MSKVTYLFGAGASAQCLPLVKDIPERLMKFCEYIVANRRANDKKFDDLPCSHTEREGEELLIIACRDLSENCRKHASIDTYAKKLYITNRPEYNSLKAVLTCFFLYEQILNEPDNRYDSFFASILGSQALLFHGDIRIVSWNYDYQFEKAYSQYSSLNSIRENQISLRVHPDGLHLSEILPRFSIFKINGTTGFEELSGHRNQNLFPNFDKTEGKAMIEKLSWYYLASVQCNNVLRSMLSFAWEGNHTSISLLNATCDQVKDSAAMVVIGYSFPFFNREVDKKIFESILNGAKIYVQDTNPEPVIERLKSVFPPGRSFQITSIDSVDQFYLPAEL